MAEVVFDLGAQQFYNSVEKNYADSTYDLDKSIVSTAMAFTDGVYRPKDKHAGRLSVQLKTPKPKWGVSFSVSCYLGDDGCGLTLLGNRGKALNINFDYEEVTVNNKTKSDNRFKFRETINGTVEANETNIIVHVAGYTFEVAKRDFQLASVTVNLQGTVEENGVLSYSIDSLSSLTITNAE